MKRFNLTEKLAFQMRYGQTSAPQPKFTVWGCYLGSELKTEGNYAWCVWFKNTYNSKLKIKGVR